MMSHTISTDATLLEALTRLNELSGGAMTLFVVDAGNVLVGTLTDGDIRRSLIGGATLRTGVSQACHRSFRAVVDGCINPADIKRFRSEGIRLIPVLDRDGHLVDTIDLSTCRTVLPLRALLMAGGKGERLRPATLKVPKPLLTIEGKAIIDYNVESLAASGVTDINVATGYLSEQLEEHFSQPVAGVNVVCRREMMPLGTIGAASMLPTAEADGCTLVMNSDLITTVSFEELYLKHRSSGADVTVAVIPYQVSVPYAILSIDSDNPDRVTGIEEKPSYSYYANAGIYIFSNRLLMTIPENTRIDATDLIESAISQGAKVSYYIIKGTWIDVGSPTDFRQAAELMRHHNSMTGE